MINKMNLLVPNVKYKKITISQDHPNTELLSIYYKSDGLLIHGFIFKKKDLRKKIPVIIYCRGGNNKTLGYGEFKLGELRPKSFYYRKELLHLVEEGKIIVFASNYRGSRFSEGVDEFGGKDVNDVVNLYPIIKKYKYSDEKKIAVYGWSRGSLMALLLHKQVPWIKCVILGAGDVDLITHSKKFRPNMYNMWRKKFSLTDGDLKKRSAIYWLNKLPKNIPILILHGSADQCVTVDSAYLLGQGLQKNKIPYRLVIYLNGDHGLTNYRSEVSDEVIRWVELHLMTMSK